MMKKLAIAMLAMMLMVGSSAFAAEGDAKCGCGEACEKASCACATAPAAVKEAAIKAVAGLKIGCIHVKKTDAGATYTVNGKAGDKAVVVVVNVDAEGKATVVAPEAAKEVEAGVEAAE